jgi:REP element-mobilizing transposase RayT
MANKSMSPISNVHHRRSIRLQGYDYTRPGAYFITIVTFEWKNLFGEIVDKQMVLNDTGKIAASEWQRLAIRFPFIELNSFVVMPNHLHGIIVIRDVGARGESSIPNSLIKPRAPTGEQFGAPVPGSIPTIIRSYKSSVTQRFQLLRGSDSGKLWQRNYYEHIIRDNEEWERIRGYIQNNPLNWKTDSENR